ncbi:MAG: MBL fold metallo-hydrolase [Fimbriimonadaceae bacterium]|nr:MBL fold metallo-hydrolase [Fimbriimonadaceae bacterium]
MIPRWLPVCVITALWLGSLYVTRLNLNQTTDIVFLQVGQGDAILIRSRGSALLVDTGPAQGDYSAGERLIAPQLRRLGVGYLDAVILTHPDLDHTGGLEGLRRRIPVDRVFTAPQFVDDLPECEVISGNIRVGEWTLTTYANQSATNDNAGGVVIRAEANGQSVLLTADLSIAGERLLPREIVANANIIKAGHHGSRGSTGDEFLDLSNPQWVVFSCGRGNGYGHPDEVALERVERFGAKIARTDRDGPVRFILENGRLIRRTM